MSIVLIVVALAVVPCWVRGQECCDVADKVFVNITDMLNTECACTFPKDKMNTSCVSSACPQLTQSDAYPLTSTGSVNQTALNKLVSIINTCLAQEKVICDVTMAHTPMTTLKFSIAQIFVNLNVTGSCSINPGSGYADNMSSARITSACPTTSGLSMTLESKNLTYSVRFSCALTLTLPPLFQRQLPVSQTLVFPHAFGILSLNMTPTVTFDRVTFQRQSNPFDMVVSYSNFVTSDGIKLPQALVDVFHGAFACFMKTSNVADAPADFLSSFITSALKVALKTCD